MSFASWLAAFQSSQGSQHGEPKAHNNLTPIEIDAGEESKYYSHCQVTLCLWKRCWTFAKYRKQSTLDRVKLDKEQIWARIRATSMFERPKQANQNLNMTKIKTQQMTCTPFYSTCTVHGTAPPTVETESFLYFYILIIIIIIIILGTWAT